VAYLGNDLQVAFPVYRNIDDISGSFNSVLTTFALTVSGVAPVPAPLYSQQCLISVGGVVQRPDDSGSEGFRLSGGNIIFASAPATGADFFGVILAGADYVNAGGNFPSGTAAVPSITFNDDLDTGIYNSGINQVSITTGGTERLRIDSAGQIESVSLGTAAAPAFSFTTDPNTGLYSPGADQVAISTNGTQRLLIDSGGSLESYGNIRVIRFSAASVISFRAAEGTQASPSAISTGFNVGQLAFNGYDGAAYRQIANIAAVSDGAITSTSSPGYLAFLTTPSGTASSQERLRITSDGKLGLGTSSPGSIVDIKLNDTNTTIGGSASVVRVNNGSGQLGATSGLEFFHGNDTSSNTTRLAAVYGRYASFNGSGLGGELIFATNTPGDATIDERMRIDSSGRVGIGTASPPVGSTLAVNGQIWALAQQAVNFMNSDNTLGCSIQGLGSAGVNPAMVFSTSYSERARIDNSGRLLVGTSTHSGLNVTSYTGLNAYFANTGDTGISLSRFQNTTNGPSVQLLKSRGTSVGSLTTVSSGDSLGEVVFAGADGDEFRAGASIEAIVDGTPGNNDMPGRLVFSTTADGASSPTERMRIAQNGVITIQNGAVAVIGTLTDAATITPDFAADCNFTVTLGGNRTIANPSNLTAGQSGSIFLVQDATGSRTVSWGSYWDFPGGTAPTLSTAANAVDRIDYVVRTSTSIHTVFTANYS